MVLGIEDRHNERMAADEMLFAQSGQLSSAAPYTADEASLENWGTAVNVSTGSAGVFALSTIIMALWTDWEGYGDE